MNKYVFHYGSGTVFWLYARSVKHLLRLLDERGMDAPSCIEDCHGGIWWKEDLADCRPSGR